MLYQVNVGQVYKFMFKPIIESFTGIYRLMTIMTPDDVVSTNVDLYKTTFKAHGVSEVDYVAQVKNLLTDSVIFKLRDVHKTGIVYYVPEFILLGQPIVNVTAYRRLGLAVNLGIFGNTNLLTSIRDEIEDMLVGRAGIESGAILFSPEEVWMVDEEYKVIESERREKISSNRSIYSDNIELKDQVNKLQSTVEAYEEIIKRIPTP